MRESLPVILASLALGAVMGAVLALSAQGWAIWQVLSAPAVISWVQTLGVIGGVLAAVWVGDRSARHTADLWERDQAEKERLRVAAAMAAAQAQLDTIRNYRNEILEWLNTQDGISPSSSGAGSLGPFAPLWKRPAEVAADLRRMAYSVQPTIPESMPHILQAAELLERVEALIQSSRKSATHVQDDYGGVIGYIWDINILRLERDLLSADKRLSAAARSLLQTYHLHHLGCAHQLAPGM